MRPAPVTDEFTSRSCFDNHWSNFSSKACAYYVLKARNSPMASAGRLSYITLR